MSNFPNRWTGRGGRQIWPVLSPDFTRLDFHVYKSYVKDVVYEGNVNTRKGLIPRMFNAARRKNGSHVVRNFKHCMVR
jgi:hypothetical protein